MISRQNKKGFTLVELLVIVAVMGAMIAVGFPNLMHYIQNNRLKTAARSIQGDFIELKLKTTSENRLYRLTFSGSSYTISRCNNVAEVPCAAYTNLSTTNINTFDSGISISGNPFSGAIVQFDTRGTITPGSVTLVTCGGSSAVITVNITGKAYVTYTLQ